MTSCYPHLPPILEGHIAEAARAYLEARRKNEAAEPCDWERARAEVERTYHDLLVACGYEDRELSLERRYSR